MRTFKPLAITYENSGLVKSKEAFVLADDAYQELTNAFIWRGRIRRRDGYSLLGRLSRLFDGVTYFDSGASPWSFNLLTLSGGIKSVDISGAPTVVITTWAPHGLQVNDDVVFNSVGGTTELNGNTYTISAVTSTTFTVSQAAPSAFTYGGQWISDRSSSTAEPDAQIKCGSFEMEIDGETITDNGDGTLTGDVAATGTINYNTGAVTITGATGSVTTTLTYRYFPTLPCMGLKTRELTAINAEQTVGFDTKFVYRFNNTSNQWEELTPHNNWSGINNNFFWTLNYWTTSAGQLFWVTNFSGTAGNVLRYYDTVQWREFTPYIDNPGGGDPNRLYQSRMLFAYRGRLVALNTYEGVTSGGLGAATHFPQRARWSQNGDPTNETDNNTWRSDVAGRGGFIDCPTAEHIVSAEFVRDTLIVGFERSTWRLRYSGNELLPFVWERINRELGTEATFSMVPFDRGVLSIGDKSINSCDGNQVIKIDENIPDEVFEIHNAVSDGPLRVHGIRDFFERLVYWTFPTSETNVTFPDRVLVFNYDNASWAQFSDSFTCFGTYQRFNDITWADLTGETWASTDRTWITGRFQSQFPSIVAGNQQGYTLIMGQQVKNSESLCITGLTVATPTMITSPDHNLQVGEYVRIKSIVGDGAAELNGRTFRVYDTLSADTFSMEQLERFDITDITAATQAVVTVGAHDFKVGDHWYIDDVSGMTEINNKNGLVTAVTGTTITLDIDSSGFTAYTSGGSIQNLDGVFETVGIASAGGYIGCGEIERVMNMQILSKKFNMLQAGRKNFIGHIDFLASTTTQGEVGCQVFLDYDGSEQVNQDDAFFNQVFSTAQEQFSYGNKEKDWHRFYCPVNAQFFEYKLSLNDRQMSTPVIADSQVQIDAIIIWSELGGRLID